MALDRTTSQVLFDNGIHKCISFTSLVKGEGVQANQFLILNNERAAVLDPVGWYIAMQKLLLLSCGHVSYHI
ncbi:MAG: hypothetical protein GAK29_00320 [Acinetobacter bereziniae]|uniref:Uncharacterized protein n=1 Tax=Acinetobacter bereziniae TaxID=106648 RepID=A0A833PHX9_ACIBZ|nr:MAG: hypothetical protein GAK29_00320 [Acinetobacter bereziniae]